MDSAALAKPPYLVGKKFTTLALKLSWMGASITQPLVWSLVYAGKYMDFSDG